jgi:hypothetical protein
LKRANTTRGSEIQYRLFTQYTVWNQKVAAKVKYAATYIVLDKHEGLGTACLVSSPILETESCGKTYSIPLLNRFCRNFQWRRTEILVKEGIDGASIYMRCRDD